MYSSSRMYAKRISMNEFYLSLCTLWLLTLKLFQSLGPLNYCSNKRQPHNYHNGSVTLSLRSKVSFLQPSQALTVNHRLITRFHCLQPDQTRSESAPGGTCPVVRRAEHWPIRTPPAPGTPPPAAAHIFQWFPGLQPQDLAQNTVKVPVQTQD